MFRISFFSIVFLLFTGLQIAGAQPTKTVTQERAEAIIKNANYVMAIVDKKKVTEGEPVTVVYKAYCSLAAELEIKKHPEFKGCSVNDFYRDENETEELINGKAYRVTTLRKLQLVPLQKGILNVEPIVIENKVFDEHKNEFTANIASPIVAVQVDPLPANAPPNFSGAVGEFKLNIKWEHDTIGLNETDKLIIIVMGTGNLQTIKVPAIAWQQGFTHYEPTEREEADKSILPMQYFHTFTIPVTVKAEGQYELPAVEFCFFNTTTHTYETITPASAPQKLLVSKASALQSLPTQTSTSNASFLWIVAGIAAVVILVSLRLSLKEKKEKIIAEKKQLDAKQNEPLPMQEAVPNKSSVTKEELIIAFDDLEEIEDNKLFYAEAWSLLNNMVQYYYNIDSTEDAVTLLRKNNADITIIGDAQLLNRGYQNAMYAQGENAVSKEQMWAALNSARVAFGV